MKVKIFATEEWVGEPQTTISDRGGSYPVPPYRSLQYCSNLNVEPKLLSSVPEFSHVFISQIFPVDSWPHEF